MTLAKPTAEMLEWHESELGVFFHFDMEVFAPEWKFGDPIPDIRCWNPKKLDTDQWLRTAKAAGGAVRASDGQARNGLLPLAHQGARLSCGQLRRAPGRGRGVRSVLP